MWSVLYLYWGAGTPPSAQCRTVLKNALQMIMVLCTTFHSTQTSIMEQTMTSVSITKYNDPIGKQPLSPILLPPLPFRFWDTFHVSLNVWCQDDSEFLTLLPPQSAGFQMGTTMPHLWGAGNWTLGSLNTKQVFCYWVNSLVLKLLLITRKPGLHRKKSRKCAFLLST